MHTHRRGVVTKRRWWPRRQRPRISGGVRTDTRSGHVIVFGRLRFLQLRFFLLSTTTNAPEISRPHFPLNKAPDSQWLSRLPPNRQETSKNLGIQTAFSAQPALLVSSRFTHSRIKSCPLNMVFQSIIRTCIDCKERIQIS